MKIHKIISRAIVTTALLGTTFGAVISGINVSASTADNYSNQSQGQAQIEDGSLTLDSVPNFNFGSNTNAAQNNSTDLKLANQDNNQLKITDYRNKNKNDGNNTRWSLNVSAAPFSSSSSQGNSNDSNNWIMTFNNQNSNEIQDNANTNIESENLTTNNNNGSNNQKIISNGKYGISEFNFDSNSASLSVPNVKPGSNYTTTMNWQLNADPRSSDN